MKLKNPPITLKKLFKIHIEDYKKTHTLRDIEKKEIEKMLSCKDEKRGYYLYQCPNCKTQHKLVLGCNSRLCSCCGKRYVDKWAEQITKKMINGIEHRHVTCSMPSIICPFVKQNRNLQKVIMDAASESIIQFFLIRS